MRLFDLRPALHTEEEQEEKAIAIAAALPNRSPVHRAPGPFFRRSCTPLPTLNGPQRELIPICAAFSVAAPFFPPVASHALLSSFSSEEVEFVPDFKVDLCIVFPLPPPPPPSCQPVSHFLFQICLPSFVSVPGAAVC